jgi:hypothetical protein
MRTRKAQRYTRLVLVGFALLLFQNRNAPRPARVGDIAAGELVSTGNEALVLNTTPCQSAQSLISFRQPYRVIRKDSGTCATGAGARQYTRVQIEQQ